MLKSIVVVLVAAALAAPPPSTAGTGGQAAGPAGLQIETYEAHDVMWMARWRTAMPAGIEAETALGQEGCIEVRWGPAALGPTVTRLIAYCEPVGAPHGEVRLPAAVWDAKQVEAGRGTIWSRQNGNTYRVAVTAVDGENRVRALGSPVKVVVADRQAPRAGWLEAERNGDGTRVKVGWTPFVLDADVKRVHLCHVAADGGPGKELAVLEAAEAYRRARPYHSSSPWLTAELGIPAGTERIGVWCEDLAGNEGQVAWVAIRPAAGAADAPCNLWAVPPTENLAVEAEPPANAKASFQLDSMRRPAKGFQIAVRPSATLEQARLSFDPLVHEDGTTTIPASWLAYHFVNYVKIERNSVSTPEEELLWKAPSLFPEELSDDLTRDLAAGRTHPIYVRVTVPRDAKPGTYQGRGQLLSTQGRQKFTITVRVWPVALPPDPRLQFSHWYQWWTH